MSNDIMTAAVLAGVSVFLLFVCLSVIWYEKQPKSRFSNQNDWLFSGFLHKFYDVLFTDKPEKMAKELKVDVHQMNKYAHILHMEIDYKNIVAMKIIAVILFAVSTVLGMVYHIVFLIAGYTVAFLLFAYPVSSIKSKAMDRRGSLESEVPRFLDLLQTALYLNMPIEQAILITAKSVDGVLSEELTESISKAQLNATGWQTVLQDLAILYDVDIFTELALDMITAYDKGVSIWESVTRKAKDIRQTHLLKVKEKATKTTSTILIPIVIFKIVPMLAFMCIPMVIQIQNGF